MNNFEFYNPVKVIFGEDSIERLGGCCKEFGQKALIVSYQDRSYYGQLFEQIVESLEAEEIAYEEYYEVTANPTIAQCEEGIKLCKDKGCNMIIGVGGGSVMDCGKMIAAGVLYEHDDIRKMVSFNHSASSEQIPPTRALPTIMIPTLPATGSEMNPTAVVTDEIAVKKSYLWAPDCLYPQYALVNPSLSTTLPKYQTACAAFDTMAHVLESYFNGDQTVDLTLQDQLQLGVLRAVFNTVDKVVEDPMNKEYRGTMQWASALALNGWVTSGTYGWAPMHQMAHVLGARYHATHGATLSVMMLAWLRYFNDRQDNKRYVQFAQEMFATSIEEAIAIMEAKMQQMGVEISIEEFGAKREDIDVLVNDVVEVSFGPDDLLASNPPLTKEDIRNIYNLACRS